MQKEFYENKNSIADIEQQQNAYSFVHSLIHFAYTFSDSFIKCFA